MTSDELFISVDIEASGPFPPAYSLLTIGACLVDQPNETFACRLKPLNFNFDPNAMAVVGITLEELAATGDEPAQAMTTFADWIESQLRDGQRAVFVGLNASFDWAFVNHYFLSFISRNPFGIGALDIKSFFMGKTGCAWGDTRSSTMAEQLAPKLKGTHDALADALYQAELFRLMRALPANPTH